MIQHLDNKKNIARFGPDKSQSGTAGVGDWAHGGFKSYRGHGVELGAFQDMFGLIILESHGGGT